MSSLRTSKDHYKLKIELKLSNSNRACPNLGLINYRISRQLWTGETVPLSDHRKKGNMSSFQCNQFLRPLTWTPVKGTLSEADAMTRNKVYSVYKTVQSSLSWDEDVYSFSSSCHQTLLPASIPSPLVNTEEVSGWKVNHCLTNHLPQPVFTSMARKYPSSRRKVNHRPTNHLPPLLLSTWQDIIVKLQDLHRAPDPSPSNLTGGFNQSLCCEEEEDLPGAEWNQGRHG